MKLLLATDAVGGVWVYSLELARALKPLGIETVLAVLGPSPDPSRLEQAAGFRLIDTGLPLDWMKTSPAELRRASEALAEIAIREDADVVQTCSAAMVASAPFDQPTVAVQHSCVASWWSAVKRTPLPADFVWRRELVGQGLRNASAVVAPTRAFAAETRRIYNLAAPVIPVHNGRASRIAATVPQADFVFTAGRLWDEGKNTATLDAAAALLKVPVEAAGPTDGPNGARIGFQHLRAIGEMGEARLASSLAVRPIFASAAIYEPFGLSVLEAAQAGCALVLSDISTHRELWDEAAMFIPPRDSDAFADAVQQLLDDRDQRAMLGRAARHRAQSYTPERMAAQMAGLYREIAAPDARSMPRQMAGAA